MCGTSRMASMANQAGIVADAHLQCASVKLSQYVLPFDVTEAPKEKALQRRAFSSIIGGTSRGLTSQTAVAVRVEPHLGGVPESSKKHLLAERLWYLP